MRRGTQRSVVTAAALGLAAAGLLGAPPASAEPECLSSSSDFDRDGTPDVVVGVPGGSGRGGAVQVRLSNEGRPLTTTITGAPGFGTAVTSLSSYAGEGDDALCSQLVVGSPEESLRTDRQRSGVVHVYAWSTSAKRFTSRGTFAPQSQGVGGTDQSGARSAPRWPPSSARPTRSTHDRRASSWVHRGSTSTTRGTPVRSPRSGSTPTRTRAPTTPGSHGSASPSPTNPLPVPLSGRRSPWAAGRWPWACPASRPPTRQARARCWSTRSTPDPTTRSP